ncbi:MAG: hypothetical protein JWM50_1701 [Microbacteriaceae bacterium]|jgi:hypothetical protein|nr:hypothetical protein [Microbacteriaceae bacterium]
MNSSGRMLTAADRLDDNSSGYELGADDYLTKRFELREGARGCGLRHARPASPAGRRGGPFSPGSGRRPYGMDTSTMWVGEPMQPEVLMKRSVTIGMVGAAVTGLALIGGGVAIAAGNGDSAPEETQTPITGSALEQASASALAFTGEGAVSETEVGDEESYYEVEVTLDSGKRVDVQLDANFAVVSSSSDHGA